MPPYCRVVDIKETLTTWAVLASQKKILRGAGRAADIKGTLATWEGFWGTRNGMLMERGREKGQVSASSVL